MENTRSSCKVSGRVWCHPVVYDVTVGWVTWVLHFKVHWISGKITSSTPFALLCYTLSRNNGNSVLQTYTRTCSDLTWRKAGRRTNQYLYFWRCSFNSSSWRMRFRGVSTSAKLLSGYALLPRIKKSSVKRCSTFCTARWQWISACVRLDM